MRTARDPLTSSVAWLRGALAAALAIAVLGAGASPALAAPDCPGGRIAPRRLLSTSDVLEYGVYDNAGRFFYSDDSKNALMVIDHAGSAPRELAAVTGPGAIVVNPDGTLTMGYGDDTQNGLVGDFDPMSGLLHVNPDTGATTVIARGLGMANGVARAPDGTFYATNDLGNDVDRVTATTVTHGWAKVFSTNGIVVSPDNRYVYVDQTFAPAAIQRITIANPSEVIPYASTSGIDQAAGPDDMTIDGAGNLYIAANGAGQIWRVGADHSICVLASGLAFPSAVTFGTGALTNNLYVVGFGGEIDELPNVRP